MNDFSLSFVLFFVLLISSSFACDYFVPDSEEKQCVQSSWIPQECEWHEVCAFFSGGKCQEEICQKYVSANGCIACKDPSILSFKEGLCKGDKVFCDPEHRPTYSNDQYLNPVCAFVADCQGDECTKTFKNQYKACQDPSVEYYIRGRCLDGPHENRTFCDINYPSTKKCDQTLEPVCAYRQDCSAFFVYPLCARTIMNGCIACQDTGNEFYVPGECPGEKIFCDPDSRPSDEEVLITSCDHEVLVYYSECEDNKPCTKRIYEPLACVDIHAVFYTLQ